MITEEEAITHKSDHGYSYHMIFKEEQVYTAMKMSRFELFLNISIFQRSFSNWINANLGNMSELAHLLPLKDDGADVYEKIGDGIMLW